MMPFPPSYQKDTTPTCRSSPLNYKVEEKNEKERLYYLRVKRDRWLALALVLLIGALLAGVSFLCQDSTTSILPPTSTSATTAASGKTSGRDGTTTLITQSVVVKGKTKSNNHRSHKIFTALLSLDDKIDGTVYLSNDSGFHRAAHVWYVSAIANERAPWAIIEVANELDVQATIKVLSHLKRNYNFPFRIRSGGHNKAGYSTVAQGAVLSLQRLNHIDIANADEEESGAAIARMGPAVRVRQFLHEVLAPHGYGGVVGFCGTVAEAGFVLGGGIGLQSRLYGLGLDNVVGMRIALADGSVRHVSSSNYDDDDDLDRDLFWALRGAGGGSFGVVTELEYRVHKVSNRLVFAFLTLPMASDMATFLYRLGARETELPGNLLVMHDQVDTAGIMWSGRNDQEIDGAAQYIETLIEELVPPEAPRVINQSEYEWTAMFDAFDSSWSPDAHAASCWYGFLLPQNNTEEIWQDMMEYISKGVHDSSGGFLLPDIELWGGAIHDTHWTATAFPYRSAIYNVGVLLTVPADVPNAALIFEEEVAKVNSWWPNVAQYLTGSYVNYPTTSLLQQDNNKYPRVYWGDNLPRLVDIKRKVDPENIFEHPMSVPTVLA